MSDATTPNGASARAIWNHLNGPECDGNYPHDSGDFGRCEAYLRVALIPHDRFAAMAEVNAYWRALVPIWAELGRMEPDALNARLREVLGPIEAADPSCAVISTGISMRMGGKIDFQGIVPPAGVGNANTDEEETLFRRAVALVWETGIASTSLIQRRLAIGYNRAASLMERMEHMSIVSKPNHVGKRNVRKPDDLRKALNIRDEVFDIAEGDGEKARVMMDAIIFAMKTADAELRKKQGKPPMKPDPQFDAAGNNSYSVTADELRSFVERIEQLDAEKKDIAEQQKELMAEAKGRGYDTKILRKVIALRKRKPDDMAEEDAVLEMYKTALGMA